MGWYKTNKQLSLSEMTVQMFYFFSSDHLLRKWNINIIVMKRNLLFYSILFIDKGTLLILIKMLTTSDIFTVDYGNFLIVFLVIN